MSFEQVLKRIQRENKWLDQLISANDLFHLGPDKFEDAVKRYAKILEILLRLLYKEVRMTVPPKLLTSAESEICEGEKPVDAFGLGQLIALFSKSNLFNVINKQIARPVLDPQELNKINGFRIPQVHSVETIVKDQVDAIREYTTKVLLQLNLISRDPEEPVEISEEAIARSLEPDARKQRIENLHHTLRKIRLELFSHTKIEREDILDKGDGWSGVVQAKAEIVGVYLDKNEIFTVIIRLIENLAPEGEDEHAYESINRQIRELIGKIAPETKNSLKILFLNEDENGLDRAADVLSGVDGSLEFCY